MNQPGDFKDWEDLFGAFMPDLQNVEARFGCQCAKCRRAEVTLRKKEQDGGSRLPKR